MEDGLPGLFKLLGFGPPFLYALATFSIFHWLDKKASGSAKKAIAGWFKPLERDPDAIRGAIIESFDWIYGPQLRSWRSFHRSAVISVVLAACYFAVFELKAFVREDTSIWADVGPYLLISVMFNIAADYLSLLVVRRLLLVKWRSPNTALMVGSFIGVMTIVLLFAFRALTLSYVTLPEEANLSAILRLMYEHPTVFLEFLREMFAIVTSKLFFSWTGLHLLMIVPAIAVHFWLPLLALGAFGVRVINTVLRSVSGMQWFLKQGRNHPFDAIGYVAAAMVFVVATAISILGRFWS